MARSKKDRTKGISDRRASNERLECKFPQCGKPQRGLGAYCTQHETKAQRYGHPTASFIPPARYSCETEEVEHFMIRFRDHPTLVAAIKWFNDWIERAVIGIPVPGRIDFRRLYDAGIRGPDCVKAVLSVWLYANRNTGRLPDDARLTFMLALSVLRLAPHERKYYWNKKEGKETYYLRTISTKTRREVGKQIRQSLGVFTYNAI